MLSAFRAFANTWAARAFFVVLVAAFALWGVADVLRNVGHDTALVTMGDRRIEPPEFQEAFRRQLAQVTGMMGNHTEPTPEIRRAVAGQTLDRLIVQAAIAQEVQRLRLVVPDDAVRQAVFDMPAFRGPNGAFDRGQFEAVLRNNGLSEGRFLELMRADIAQRQLVEAVETGVAAPEELLKEVYAFQRETRVADIVTLPFSAAPAPPAPSADDLQRVYENDPAAYSAPAYRRIKVVILSPDTLARGIDVSDDDIKAYYEAHKADYVTPEKRSAEVIVSQDEAAAQKLAAAWMTGADWPAMQKAAQDAGASAVSFDDATKPQFPSADLADAVFKAAPQTVTGPIKSAFGWQVFRVAKVTPGASRTLDEVKGEVKTNVARERAIDQVYTKANKLDDALSAGTKLEDLPGDLGAAALSGTLDAQGNTQAGEPAPIPGTPALRQAIVSTAFSQAKDDAPRMIEGPDQSYYAVQVDDIIEPKLKPLSEVEAQVRADYLSQQRRHEQEEAAAKLLSATQAGGSLEDAAAVAGLHVEKTPPIGRNNPPPGVPGELVQPLFQLKQGETTMAETPESFIVARLAQISTPDPASDPAGAAQIRDALNHALQQDVDLVFANVLRDRAKPRIRTDLLESAIQ